MFSWDLMKSNSDISPTEEPATQSNPFGVIGSKKKSDVVKDNLFDGFGSLETFLKAPDKKTLEDNDGPSFFIDKDKW